MALHKGWDILITEPGEHESMTCPVCNQEMEVKRNVNGPTSWAGAIMRTEHLHDTFTCKSAGKKWHKQVRHLREAIISTPSGKLASIFQEEINEILHSKRATKEVSDF
jgi:hypothetical protein